MRIGALVPNSGRWPLELGIPRMAATLEEAGFDSLWVSDHIVLPQEIVSRYPFADDGRATWPTDTPYFDALIAMALIAGATSRATIGTAVLVLPLRHPIVFAKQAASLDRASGGRLRLGVGAGWLEEEFIALDVPFADRNGRLVEWIAIARDCWTGTPAARTTDRYTLPAGTLCLPTPESPIPFLVGGHSPTALRRAGRLADGWLGQQSLDALDPMALANAGRAMRDAAVDAGRALAELQVVLRVVDSAGRPDDVAAAIPALAAAGVDEIIVNVDWEADAGAQFAAMSGTGS